MVEIEGTIFKVVIRHGCKRGQVWVMQDTDEAILQKESIKVTSKCRPSRHKEGSQEWTQAESCKGQLRWEGEERGRKLSLCGWVDKRLEKGARETRER